MTKKTHGKNAFMFVLVCVAIDMMGFGLIMPVLPSLVSELSNLPVEQAVAWGGYLMVLWAVTNFLSGPVLGGLSDRFGRRPVLILSMGMLALDFLIMGLAHSLWLLFLGRFLSGISAATISTASAYIADVTSKENRGRAFGMIGAAFGLGFVVGPVLGGLLGQYGPRIPFYVAAGLCFLNTLYGIFVLPESLPVKNRRPFDFKRANPFGAFRHFSKLPRIGWVLVAMCLFSMAHTVFPATWSYHGQFRYGWTPRDIGLSLGLVGIGAAIVQSTLVGPAIQRFGAVRTAFIGLFANAVALVGFGLAETSAQAYFWCLACAFGGLTGPATQAHMSNNTPADAQGELQGAAASIQSLASIISPLIMTQTLQYFASDAAPVYLPGAAFFLAAALTGIAMLPFALSLKIGRGSDDGQASPEESTKPQNAPA